MAIPLWIQEFGTEYDVPNIITETLIDTSWHNDVAPSFELPDSTAADEDKARLWVEHPLPCDREFEGPRYTVTLGPDVRWTGDDHALAIAALMLAAAIS